MRTRSWTSLSIAFVALLSACGSTTTSSVGGETNWLRTCTEDRACGDYGSCMCGLCSEGCDQDDDCPSGLVCQPPVSQLVTDACGDQSEHGICSPECDEDADCGTGQACIQQACAPTASGSTGESAADAYVVAAIKPDADCNALPESALIVPVGSYDIANDFEQCVRGYRPIFKLASFYDGLIQVSGAEVRLMDLSRSPISFDRTEPPLPNPFEIVASQTLLPTEGETTLGAMTLELIPALYGEQLDGFVGDQVLAEIKVHARDEHNRPLTIPSFLYAIDICDGCLMVCGGMLDPEFSTDEIYGTDTCIDNAAADGRICVDFSCVTP